RTSTCVARTTIGTRSRRRPPAPPVPRHPRFPHTRRTPLMLIEQTLTLLHTLRLTGMAAALEEQRGVPDVTSLGFEDRFALLLEREQAARADRRLTRLLQLARFRVPACVEDINFRAPRGLDRATILRLAGGDWIRAHQVLLLVGPTGTGKTWLACALGQSAC